MGDAAGTARPAPSKAPADPRPRSLDRTKLRQYLERSEWPLAAFALLFLVAYGWPILQPSLGRGWKDACDVATWATWAVFLCDYLARVSLAGNRRQYFQKHLLDLLIVALPILRPLRLLRLVILFRVLNRKAAASLRGRVPLYVSISAATLVCCAALAVLAAERGHAGANINNFGQALWWAVVTVTTVGYGDHFPVTVEGRCIAVGLMIGGVALIGVVTASFAAWFIDRVRDEEEANEAATRRDLEQLTAQVAELTAEVRALRADREGAATR
jgi:voltage-gated potassium channel